MNKYIYIQLFFNCPTNPIILLLRIYHRTLIRKCSNNRAQIPRIQGISDISRCRNIIRYCAFDIIVGHIKYVAIKKLNQSYLLSSVV